MTPSRGVLPRDYGKIDKSILRDLLKALNVLEESPEGDVYGRVYEYFLGAFAPETLQKGGEYFTPFSVVRLIVEILEPYEGRIFDPACGSGGMFVQSARFIAEHQRKTELSVFGQEKTRQTIQLCRMNLAVHGLNGTVKEVTSSLYEFPVEKEVKEGFDFVMSNPPFNLKGVDKARLKDDQKHYPWGVSGGDNANYLWIQRFYTALNEKGRAGFVMANGASDAGGRDAEVRRSLISTGAVDVMVRLSGQLFYTVPLEVTLWFFDRAKESKTRLDQVLFIDARSIFEQVDKIHRTLAPWQIEYISNIVRLWRGEPAENRHDGLARTAADFPDGYRDKSGLCRAVSRSEIEKKDWSLNAARYVTTNSRDRGIEQRSPYFQVTAYQDHLSTLSSQGLSSEIGVQSLLSTLLGASSPLQRDVTPIQSRAAHPTATVDDLIHQGILSIGDGYRAKNSELGKTGLPFARAGNIDDGFHFEEADCLCDESVEKAGDKASRPGDIVFTSKGTVGRFALVRETTPRFVYSPQLCFWRVLRPDVLSPSFLFRWMRTHAFSDQVDQVKGSTTMADYVSLKDQRRMKVDLPPASVQRHLDFEFTSLDSLIDNYRDRCFALSKLRDLLLPRLLSGELDVSRLPLPPDEPAAAPSSPPPPPPTPPRRGRPKERT